MCECLSGKLERAMKVKDAVGRLRWDPLAGAPSTDLEVSLKDLSESISVRTRKTVNYS